MPPVTPPTDVQAIIDELRAQADRATKLVPYSFRTVLSDTNGGGASVTSYRGGYSAAPGAGGVAESVALLTQMKCFPGTPNGYSGVMWTPFRGRGWGLRVTAGTQVKRLVISIDGEPFVPYVDQLYSELASVNSPHELRIPITRDLPDGNHWAGIFLLADPVGGIVRQADVLGGLADDAAGYPPPEHFAFHGDAVTVPTVAAALTMGPGAIGQIRANSAFLFWNTASVPVRISLTHTSGLTIPVDLEPTGTAGDFDVFNPVPRGLTLDDRWTIVGSVAGAKYLPVAIG